LTEKRYGLHGFESVKSTPFLFSTYFSDTCSIDSRIDFSKTISSLLNIVQQPIPPTPSRTGRL
jgi:hypothetical protein